MQSFRVIGQLFVEISHLKELGDTECRHECSFGVYLVIDNLLYVPSDALPLYQHLKQSNN